MTYTTRKSLLIRVGEGDEVSWFEFYNSYKRLILKCYERKKFPKDSAEDFLQQVMLEIFEQNARRSTINGTEKFFMTYDLSRGLFRNYLGGVIRNQLGKFAKIYYARRAKEKINNSKDISSEMSDDSFEEMYQTEYNNFLKSESPEILKKLVKPHAYQVFEHYVIKNNTAQDTAKFFDISIAAVYTDKNRCVQVLKEVVKYLQNELPQRRAREISEILSHGKSQS